MSLQAKFSKILSPSAGTPYDVVVAKLREIAGELETAFGKPSISARVEPGHAVNAGQQFRFVVRLDDPKFSDTLFRCYVPTTGYPVTLSLYEDENVTCDSAKSLEDSIAEFLGREPIAERLRSIKALA
ncbi:MAG: hypothetical protein AAF550_06480 [Myxococcota bacterium]